MSEEDYWTRQEKYLKLAEKSQLSWHKLYSEEKVKREELEERYNLLVQRLKKEGKKRVDELSYYDKLEKMAKDMDEPWDEERADIVGQNGNDGLHYIVNDDGTKCKVHHKTKKYVPEFGKLEDVYGQEKSKRDK